MIRSMARGVFLYNSPVPIIGYASIVGKKEGEGPLGKCFDRVEEDAYFGTETWEQAECALQQQTLCLALEKAGLSPEVLSLICAGDLNSQCIASTFGLRDLELPFLGIYGACSTMLEGILVASVFADSGVGEYTGAVTSSHFSTAERQFRFPLAYGNQRPPTAQWTCTASGAVLLQKPDGETGGIGVAGGCVGKIVDLGVTDANNMGAAMAPAAADTLLRYFQGTGTIPAQYDAIVTGDLGLVGSQLFVELLLKQGYDITAVHRDCGVMIFDEKTQDTHAGGSGCGCIASVLCGYFLPKLQQNALNRVLFLATGALLSPTTCQQGETIPGIAHLCEIVKINSTPGDVEKFKTC